MEGEDPGFPRGGANAKGQRHQQYSCRHNFLKNEEKIGPGGFGGWGVGSFAMYIHHCYCAEGGSSNEIPQL